MNQEIKKLCILAFLASLLKLNERFIHAHLRIRNCGGRRLQGLVGGKNYLEKNRPLLGQARSTKLIPRAKARVLQSSSSSVRRKQAQAAGPSRTRKKSAPGL